MEGRWQRQVDHRQVVPAHQTLALRRHEEGEDGRYRFLVSGFTPAKEIVVLSDTTKDFELETLYNQITDGFTVEDKGVDKLVIAEDKAPK